MERILFTPMSGYEPPHVKVRLHGDIPAAVPTTSLEAFPSILVCRHAKYAPDLDVGSVDPADMILFARGDSQACLLILIDHFDREMSILPAEDDSGEMIIDEANRVSDELGAIAKIIVHGLRNIDGKCRFTKKISGKWMNFGTNFFTLKIQSRNNDIQFTIYGNPWSYDHNEFLKKDQNSYSRGWIKNRSDAAKFLKLARESYDRRAMP